MADTKTVMSLIATSSTKLRDLSIKNGQLIFCQDRPIIAFDFNSKRNFYNQIVEVATEAERANLESPENGRYYFVIDTASLWTYQNDEWIQISEPPREVIFIGAELPELGSANKLYVDTDNKEISIWDDDNKEYVVVSDRVIDVDDEDIENLFK